MAKPERSRRRLIYSVIVVSVMLCVPVAVWAWRVFHWYSIGYPQHLQQKRQWVLTQANHAVILQECRQMLANPGQFPQAMGESFPKNLPPTLASLGATSIQISPNGVLIMFDRHFALFAAPANAPSNPPLLTPSNTQLVPGLWYLTYPGN